MLPAWTRIIVTEICGFKQFQNRPLHRVCEIEPCKEWWWCVTAIPLGVQKTCAYHEWWWCVITIRLWVQKTCVSCIDHNTKMFSTYCTNLRVILFECEKLSHEANWLFLHAYLVVKKLLNWTLLHQKIRWELHTRYLICLHASTCSSKIFRTRFDKRHHPKQW